MRFLIRYFILILIFLTINSFLCWAVEVTTNYHYDKAGRLIETDTNQVSITYTYDKNGNLIGREIKGNNNLLNIINIKIIPGSNPLTFQFSCKVNSNRKITNYIWNFGDGSSTITHTNFVTHTYPQKGSYTLSLVVENDIGIRSKPYNINVQVNSTLSNWKDITTILSIAKSRPIFDRHHRCFLTYIKIKNNSGIDINGPIRLVIVNPTLPIDKRCPLGLKVAGTTLDGNNYFEIIPKGGVLKAGASTGNLRVNFRVMRKRLSFGIRIEQYEQIPK